jgi:hypothetical protein
MRPGPVPGQRSALAAARGRADLAYIIGGGELTGPAEETRAAAAAPTAKRARKGRRPSVAGKSKKNSARRWACWKCGGAMRKKGLACKRCRKTSPAAVKAQLATLTKAYGGSLRPAAVPAMKAAKPRCPNPACGARGGRRANACARCGAPFTPVHAARAEKAARRVQLSIAGSAAYWEAQARQQWNPAAREACYAEARKARQARGTENSSLVSLLVKASGAGSVREAWLKEADPHAREVLLRAINHEGGRSA